MQNFSFNNPTRILFGRGQIAALANEIPAASRILLCYGGGSIRRNGTYEQLQEALAGHRLIEFGGIGSNPEYRTLLEAVGVVRDERIDFILAVGGGSVIDGAKFIAAASLADGDPWQLIAAKRPVKAAIPVGVVLTLPATGSESNPVAIISRAETGEKRGLSSPLLYPRFAVLDPQLTFSLPPQQLSLGVVDAFVHVIEQYLTYPVEAPLQDRLAESILVTLREIGPRLLEHEPCYQDRATLMWAANLALNGLIGCGVPQDWSSHVIGHQLTSLYGIAHAQTLAVLLPAVLKQQREPKRSKLVQYGRRVWNLDGSDEQVCQAAIDCTEAFFVQMHLAIRLGELGLDASKCEPVIELLARNRLTPLGEHHDMDLEQCRRVLQLSL
jgi:NADP-dependent alcohol dehydrogenase